MTPSRGTVSYTHLDVYKRQLSAREGEPAAYEQVCERVGATGDGERASAIELALEGLYLARKISKETGGGTTIYG